MNQHSDLCQIFELLSQTVWNDLKDGFGFNLPIGEEGITDHALLDLKRLAGAQVTIYKFDRIKEGKTTGADWEWWLCGGGKAFGMRIQAKKLDSKSLRYESLDHKVRGSRKKQINLLLKDAAAQPTPLYPIYCFYNYWPDPAPNVQWNCKSFPPKWGDFGCSVADARLIKRCLASGIRDLSRISSISHPWMCLVCCTGFVGTNSILPERARSVAQALAASYLTDPNIRLPNPIVPELTDINEVPQYVKEVLGIKTPSSGLFSESLSERPIDGLLVVQEES